MALAWAAVGPLESAWADGSATQAGLPGLARAAWAVRFGEGLRAASGPARGAQTAPRGELLAAAQAAARRRGPLLVATDSRLVASGVATMARLRGPRTPPTLTSGLPSGTWAAVGLCPRGGSQLTAPAPSPPPALCGLGGQRAGRCPGRAGSGLG